MFSDKYTFCIASCQMSHCAADICINSYNLSSHLCPNSITCILLKTCWKPGFEQVLSETSQICCICFNGGAANVFWRRKHVSNKSRTFLCSKLVCDMTEVMECGLYLSTSAHISLNNQQRSDDNSQLDSTSHLQDKL